MTAFRPCASALYLGTAIALLASGIAPHVMADHPDPANTAVATDTVAAVDKTPVSDSGESTLTLATATDAHETPASAAIIPASSQRLSPEELSPLAPCLRAAREGIALIDSKIKDYSCTLVKRERIGGSLRSYQMISLKIRHEPFSVYMHFLGPKSVKDRECLYVAGRNDNQLIAHEGQGLMARLPSVKLDPFGAIASAGQRYPITEVGIRRLCERLLDTGENDSKYGECEVKQFANVAIKGRSTHCIQVTHPQRRDYFRYHVARIFVDDELKVPVRYVGYLWPDKPGGKPVLDEEYTYLNVKINNGFTDFDFDPTNPDYKF